MEGDEQHWLTEFLTDILPTLSLDPETYCPYITGCVDTFENQDELDEIIELCRASSESHSDNEEVWVQLKADILVKHEEFKQMVKKRKEQELEELNQEEAKKKLEELQEIQKIEEQKKRDAEERELRRKQMDPAQRALLEQYAYDQSEAYDNEGNLIENNTNEDAEEPVNNRQLAEQMRQEKTQQMRTKSSTSKKEEQMKTKNAKIEKMKQKEERQKRAQKGERKR